MRHIIIHRKAVALSSSLDSEIQGSKLSRSGVFNAQWSRVIFSGVRIRDGSAAG